jgi:gliding motility-associated-like protein
MYNFTLTNSSGCVSAPTPSVTITEIPPDPVVQVTSPSPVCSPNTIDLTEPAITRGYQPGLTYTYWINPQATIPYNNAKKASGGTYYIKGSTADLCYDIKSVTVTINPSPKGEAGRDQTLEYQFETSLQANDPLLDEKGKWSIIRGTGKFTNPESPSTTVTDLSMGKNVLLWTLTNKVCPPSSDSVTVTVKDLTIPTLITPNMDGRNDYFILHKLDKLGKTELIIFDRKGLQVFRTGNYKNDWNGTDQDGNPLPEGTYFYILKSADGKSVSNYIVIRREK